MSELPEVRAFIFAGECRVAVRGAGIFADQWYVNGPVLGSRLVVSEALLDDHRPLVVIDPEDEAAVDRVADAIRNHHRKDGGVWTGIDWLNVQAALRSLVTPPKPDEPTGLGAVVEDAEGERWLRWEIVGRHPCPWSVAGSVKPNRSYDDIDAVRVLSEGVTP